MNNGGVLGSAAIQVTADTASAVAGLRSVSRELDGLVPGGNAVASVFERIQGGALQLVQGMSRNIFQGITQSMTKLVSTGIKTAKTLEMSKVAFDNLLTTGEDVDQLLMQIQEDATKTPFDVDALALSTQKLALITKNGAQAEATALSLGKALAAAGRGTAELNRMATNLQQIGQNAKATERDLREFGNSGIDIIGIVTQFSDEFKQAGIEVTEAREWLKKIDDPYTVIANALNKAGEAEDGFARIYEEGALTIGQALENMNDSFGIFSSRVMEQTGVLTRFKAVLREIQDELLLNHEFTANAALAIERLIAHIQELDIIRPILQGIQKVVSAFAAGQFDNIIVFFQNLFNAIKQFTGLQVVRNALKVIFDLFSDNHTAEEVARVATQIGNLVRMFLELKMAIAISDYAYRLTTAIMQIGQGVSILIPKILTLGGSFATARLSALSLIGVFGALVAAVAIFANVSGGSVTDVLDSIASGVKGFIELLGNAAKQMVTFGWNLIVGLYNGLVEAFKTVIGKIKEMAQAIIDTFASVFQIHSPSKVMRDYIGKNLMLGIIEGINSMRGEVAAAIEEVQEELVKLQSDFVQELADFGVLDLVEQVRVYKEFASLYQKGTKARLEADENVHDAETAIIKEMIRLIEDFNKAFDKAYKKAKDFYNMFEYTQITLTRTTKSVIEGLNRQNSNMEKYYKNIYKMSQMGFDEDFMSYVYEQGLDAASEVAGLADATEEQIEEINRLWEERGKIATDIAMLNTQTLREETLEELEYLNTGLENKVVDFYDAGVYLVYDLNRGILDMIPTVEDAMANLVARASSAAKGAADDSLYDIDSDLLTPTLGNTDDFIANAHKMELQIYDTTDALSFLKNMLSGIPWWGWAVAAGGAISGALRSIGKFSSTTKSALGTATTAGNAFASAMGRDFKRVTTEVLDLSSSTVKANATFKQGAKTASASFDKMANDIDGVYTRTVTETRKAAKQVNDITYTSATKQGENLLRPFKTFNTRVKGLFSSIQTVINSFLDLILNTIKHFVKGVMDILEVLAKGIGNAIKAMLKPLSDKKLLTGVAVLAGLAGTILILAAAGKVLNGVEWESLAKLAAISAALVGVAKVMELVGKGAKYILIGAAAVAAAGLAIGIAAAAIGAGVLALVACIKLAGDLGKEIQSEGFVKLGEALSVLGMVFLETIALNAIASISGALAMAVALEVSVIATALLAASALARSIDVQAFDYLAQAIKSAVAMLIAIDIAETIVAGLMGVFATIVSGELAVIAIALRVASELGTGINIEAINRIGEAIKAVVAMLVNIALQSIAGAYIGAFVTLVSVEFLVIAASLRGASELGKGIVIEYIDQIGTAITHVVNMLVNIAGQSIAGAFIGAFADAVSIEFLIIAASLRKASEAGQAINLESIEQIGEAVKKVVEIMKDIDLGQAFSGALSGWFSTVVSVEFMSIAAALAEASNAAKNIDINEIPNIGEAIKEMNKIDFGDFWENWGKANASGKAKDVAKNVDEIVSSLTGALEKIQKLKDYTKETVTDSMAHASELMSGLLTLDMGNEDDNKEKKKVSEKLAEVTESVDKIIGTISDAITKLADLNSKVGGGQITGYIEQVKGILTQLSGFDLKDEKSADDNGWFSQTKLDKTKQATAKIAELAEQIGKMMSSVKEIVDIFAEFSKNEISPEKARSYVSDTKTIIEEFAKVEVSQEVTDATKDNVSKIAEVAENSSKIITSARDIVNSLRELEEKEITPDKVKEYVGKANEVIAKFGELALPEKADGAYDKLSDNSSKLASATGSVKTILENAAGMVELVEKYKEAIEGKDVDIMVQQINKMLAQIAGGNAYADGKDDWHKGISIPDNATLGDNDVNKLESIKKALDEVKSIAELVNDVPETAEHIGGVESIIDFIKETMSQLPEAMSSYSESFEGIGSQFAGSFKTGWESMYPSIAQAGEALQSQLWQAIEGKMNDEKQQGAWMATNFLLGWQETVSREAFDVGIKMQSALWAGIESRMQDEFLQGKALGMRVVDGIYDTQDWWWGAGDDVVAGFAGGIYRNMWQINQAAGYISATAVNKLKQLLDIHSPSRVFAELGQYVAEGFAGGIEDSLSEVENAGEALAEAVMSGYDGAIEPLELSAYEARAVADRSTYNGGFTSRSTSVIQNNNIYNDMDMAQALSQIAWDVSRA